MVKKTAAKKAGKKPATKATSSRKTSKKAAPARKAAAKKPAAKKPASKSAAGAETPVRSAGKLPRLGAAAPGFSLPAADGSTVSLADFRGRQVVVYFYPKADTPGCTKEACGFNAALASFRERDVAVVGISPDPVKDVRKFSGKFSLGFPLLADADHEVCEAYGVWVEKSMYGRTYMGAARTTFIIDADGRVAGVFEKVTPDGHDAEVLAWLEARG